METPKYIITPPETVDAKTADVFNELPHSGTPVRCPTCGQIHNITYRRGLYPALVKALRFHKDGTKSSLSDFAKLRFWGLIYEAGDGWSTTDAGVSFFNGESKVPMYVFVKNNKCIGFNGPMVTIYDVLDWEKQS